MVAASSGTFYGQPMTQGDIYTVAGTGTGGYSGDGGVATSAELYYPSGVTVDAAGNVLIADAVNDRIRVVAASIGYVLRPVHDARATSTPSPAPGPRATPVTAGRPPRPKLQPLGVAVDASGNVLIADSENDRVRVVAATSGTFYGQSMTQGDIYTIAGTGTQGYSGDGGAATSAELYYPEGVAVDASANILISDGGNQRIREVAAYGTQTITFTSTQPSGAFYGGPSYSVGATGGASGNSVTFWSATPGVCSVSGSSASFVGVGTCTIDADQAGNADYDSAPQVSQSFTVAQASQVVSFTSSNPSPVVVGGPSYTPTASGGGSTSPVVISLDSGSTGCTLNGGVVQFTTSGTCLLDANQAGDANYFQAVQVQQSITVDAQCSPGYYSATGGAPCTAAQPGEYVSTSGATTATDCAVGTYQPNSGQSACLATDPGSFVATTGAISESACPAGTYQPNSGQSACLAADPGNAVASTGATSETPCAVGTYQPESGQSACLPADPGSYVGTAGAIAESACGLGTYSSLSGQSSCTAAPAGTYVDTTWGVSTCRLWRRHFQSDHRPDELHGRPGGVVCGLDRSYLSHPVLNRDVQRVPRSVELHPRPTRHLRRYHRGDRSYRLCPRYLPARCGSNQLHLGPA